MTPDEQRADIVTEIETPSQPTYTRIANIINDNVTDEEMGEGYDHLQGAPPLQTDKEKRDFIMMDLTSTLSPPDEKGLVTQTLLTYVADSEVDTIYNLVFS